MSWSVSAQGTPKEVSEKLEEYGAGLSGDSKTEFDAAKPHLLGLVGQNYPERKLDLSAHGHGITARECSCTLKGV